MGVLDGAADVRARQVGHHQFAGLAVQLDSPTTDLQPEGVRGAGRRFMPGPVLAPPATLAGPPPLAWRTPTLATRTTTTLTTRATTTLATRTTTLATRTTTTVAAGTATTLAARTTTPSMTLATGSATRLS